MLNVKALVGTFDMIMKTSRTSFPALMVTGQSEHLYAGCTTEALGASQMFSRISNAGKIPVAISRNDWS